MEHPLNSAKYQSALFNKLARIYCECLCIRKAHEYSEAASVMAKMDKSGDIFLQFKFRLAHCLTKRRLGDYLEALADINKLFEETIVEQSKAEVKSKRWDKLTRLLINILKERLTLQCCIRRFGQADQSF